jgi:hypothetical protein
MGCAAFLLSLQTVGAADDVGTAVDSKLSQPPSKTVRVTTHVVPTNGPEGQERTLLDLFSSWIGGDDTLDDRAPAVKVEPKALEGQADLVVVPKVGERDAIVPIDPSPKPALAETPEPTAMPGAARPHNLTGDQKAAEPEPLGVLTMRLVSTSLVTASLWGKSMSTEDEQEDDLDRFASVAARRLDRPYFPVSRRLLERARPPLKAGRIITNEDGIEFLTPIEPMAAAPSN